MEKNHPTLQLELQPTHPNYKIIEHELDKLKQLSHGTEKIILDDASNKAVAPFLFEIISKPLAEFCAKLEVNIPKIVIYFGNSADTYNAIADRDIEYWEDSRGETIKTLKVENCEFIIGQGILKLILWDVDGEHVLEGLIAHEMSHLKQDENMQQNLAELDADASAIKLLGKNKAEELIKAINISMLSAHIFNILIDQACTFRLTVENIHRLNCIITNSIIKNNHKLGDLGRCTSHAIFGFIINKVLNDALSASFDAKIGLTERTFCKLYENFECACKNVSTFMEEAKLSVKRCGTNEQSNKYFSPTTHPTPEHRYAHIQHCINQA
ncbi:MAG: hypothetical protein US49_C0006G0135 [candidate division TM6 bacterium GW2011_GWF2_37_49]|nr:MAG: hypothetical protein US49_C0006G0135 [candidate division TM6 bacterium GW2011_GWF2_37_49]